MDCDCEECRRPTYPWLENLGPGLVVLVLVTVLIYLFGR